MREVPRNAAVMRITDFRSAALISIILVLPFAVLEYLNQGLTQENVPGVFLLFGVLWLLPTVFIVVLMRMVRDLRAGHSLVANPINLLLRIGLLSVTVMVWGSLLMDQMPCFIGVPNCD